VHAVLFEHVSELDFFLSMLKGFSPYLFGGLEFLDILCVLDEVLDYCIGLFRPVLRLVF
jgi:phage-related holin